MTRTIRLLVPLLAALALATGCDKQKTCSSDQTLCGDTCATLDRDPQNCGQCGYRCGPNYRCEDSACQCKGDRTVCGAACADLASDPENCGTCGNACTGGWVCTPTGGGTSACAVACTGGLTGCGSACVDLGTHRDNCGACGRTCGTGEQCTGGRCVADLYLACFNSDEVREATSALAAAGLPIAVAPGPNGFAWTGTQLAVTSSRFGGAETLTMLRFDPPGLRQARVLETSVPNPDIEYLAEHDGLLYVSHNSLGTLLVVTPAGHVVDEVRLVPSGAPNPNPQGIAFDGAQRAFVALEDSGEVLVLDVSHVPSCASGQQAPPCASELARVDLNPAATPGAQPKPVRIVLDASRAYVALWNLDATFSVVPGSTGKVGVIRTDTLQVDAAFAGTTSGAIDLGPDCLNAADVALHGGKLWVTCGAFTFPTISGSGVVPVDLSGPAAQALPMIAGTSQQAPGKLAFCGASGYVGDRNSGTVWTFDPAAPGTSLGAGVALCPVSSGYAFVADIACGR